MEKVQEILVYVLEYFVALLALCLIGTIIWLIVKYPEIMVFIVGAVILFIVLEVIRSVIFD